MKPGARFVLTFGLREDEDMVAKFPTTVYHFYTKDEVRSLLEEAGFSDIHLAHHQVASRTLVFAMRTACGMGLNPGYIRHSPIFAGEPIF
jgi:hypothetical protein